MKKGIKKLLALVLTVFTFALAGVLYGCGDPYKDARVSITTPATIALSIDASGNAESTTVSVKVTGMPDGSSSQIISKEIDKNNIAIIDEDSIEYDPSSGVTTFSVVARGGGEAKLVVRAEGGKQATANIVVEERLRSFSFNETYKPTIFVGKVFSVDSFGLNFENETATNKNVNIDLQRETNNGYVTVATLNNGTLTRNQTAVLSTSQNYFLRAITVDGGFVARKKVAVVEEIDPNEISIYLNNSTDIAPVEKITLATNIDSLTSKTFYIDVNGRRNLKYEVTTDEKDLICKVTPDHADPSVFTVTKQNRGISTVTVRVGYEDSFDYYSVTKDYAVEVYSEPKSILIDGLIKNETTGEEELNVFSTGSEWQLLDLSIDPPETNYKDVTISFLSDDYRKGIFRFGVQSVASSINELNFTQNGDYVYATYNSNYDLYVSIANQTAAANNENFNVIFTSERNNQATKTVKLYAREQISGFNLTSGIINNVDINNDGNPVDIIFAPNNSADTRVEFSYETGYGDIILLYNQNRIEASLVTIDRETKSGYFTIRGNGSESISTLNIYNGDRLQTSVVVVAATATNTSVQVDVETNNSLAILTDKNDYRDIAGYDRYIVFNNESGTAPVEIKLKFSDEQASILNYSVNIEKVDEADANEISYVNNALLVANKSAEAKAYLTFKLMYFVLNENELNVYSIRQFDYKILINYSPELAENMVAFAHYQNDKAITYAELLDYTTAGDRAEDESILDLEVFVVGDSTGSFFTIKSVECVLPASASKYLTVKNNLTPSETGRFRFQILAGDLERETEEFVLTFNILQDGRTKKIEKQFTIIVNKLSVVTGIALDPSVKVSAGGNGGNGAIYNVMQMGENGETENLTIVNSKNADEKVSFNNLEVSVVSVEPNDYSIEKENDALPIFVNSGVITRVGEGAAKVTIKLKSTATLNKNVWAANGQIEYIINEYNSIVIIVKCYGVSIAKDIFNANDFVGITANGKFTIANNIDLTGVKFNLARFNAESELDGNNYIVYGLNQNSALFNANYGTIKNLNLIINQTITASTNALGAICQQNYGTIDNVAVNGNVAASTQLDFVYGAVAANNYASITNSSAQITLNLLNSNNKITVGAISGVNEGSISGVYMSDTTETETTPDVSLTVNGVNATKAQIGGVAGKNNGGIFNIKADAIVNGSALQNVVAGGVTGVDSNGNYSYVSGSLVTSDQILSGGLVIGRANNNITLANAKGVVRLNTTNNANKTVALPAFSATNAGGIIGEAYETITLDPSIYVVGFVLSVEDTSSDPATTYNVVSEFNGTYAGGIVGKAAAININSSDVFDVALEDVNIVGSANKGLIAGSVGADVMLDSDDEDNYVFNAYYAANAAAFELTTEAAGNTPVKDANNNNVYIFVNGVKTQLYYNANRPIYEIADDFGIYTEHVYLDAAKSTEVNFGYKVYEYNNSTSARGSLISNAYAKLMLIKGTSGSENAYNRTYKLVTSSGEIELTRVRGEYMATICSYDNGSKFVYIKEDEPIVAKAVTNIIDLEQNEYDNYVTKTTCNVDGKNFAAGTIIRADEQSKYLEDSIINFNDSRVYTYASKSGSSSVNDGAIIIDENSTVMLNGAEVDRDNLSNYYFGEKVETAALARMAPSVYSARSRMASGKAFGAQNANLANNKQASRSAVFAAAVAGSGQTTENEPTFIVPEGLENGQSVKSNYISTLGANAVNGEIYGINPIGVNSDMQDMYVLLEDVNATTIFDLGGLINNLRYYSVNVYSENNIAKLYANTLVVNGAGTIALTLTPYSSISSTSYIMLIRVAQKPNAEIYTKTISGQTKTINNLDRITLTSGSEFVFYANNVMSPTYSVSGNGTADDEISRTGNRFEVKLKGSNTQVLFSDSVNFASETINIAGVEYTIGSYVVKYREWTFEVAKGYNLEFVSANLSSAQITKNDEVYLTLKIKVYGYVEDVSSVISSLDFINEVVGGNDAPELAYQILNVSPKQDALDPNATLITINVLYYIANKNVEINSGYNANIIVKANDEVSTKVELKIVPQTISHLTDVLTPLYGKQIYTEGTVIFDKVAAQVVLTPAFFYNDVSSINVSASVAIKGAPDRTYGTTIVSATGATLDGKSTLRVEKKNVLGEDNYNKFVFYVYISARGSVSSEDIKNSTVTLEIKWGKNNEYSQVITYKVSEIPDLQFDTSVPYYAIGGEKELTVVNRAGEKVNLAEAKGFEAFGIESIEDKNGIRTILEKQYNDNTKEYYIGSGSETDTYYIKRDATTSAGTFVSNLEIGTNVTLGIFAKVDVGNGKEEVLLINRFKVTIVLYTIEDISLTTPSGLQQLDREIPIEFDVRINYSSNVVSADEAQSIRQGIIAKLKEYWTAPSVNDNTARYIELWYKSRTAGGADGESILRSQYYYGVERGAAKFLVIPKVNDDKTFGNGYRIWGTQVNTPISIELRTYIVYKNGVPELQVYNGVDHSDHIMLTREFNFEFYQLSTEENPTPINSVDQFINLLSSEASINEHFRLMTNITLNNYSPIAANFASLDGNGYVIYLDSFASDPNATGDISLGLFSSIGQNTLVKNLSVAVGELKTVGENSSVLALENYSSVTIGLITPENHGYIANCEVVNFDLQRREAVNTTIQISTAYGVETVVGGLVAHNYGSIVNSRVGRSVNSDYKYLGYFTTSNNGTTTLDEDFKIADEATIKENGISISASGTIGGVVAYNHKTDSETGIISSCYFAAGTITNTASVVETSYTGGLAAFNEGQIALSSVEGRFSQNQLVANDEDRDLLVRQGAGISSNGNIGGFVFKNTGSIADSYSNITINTQARSAAFVYNTEDGTVDNAYAFSSSSSTTNNAPFVGLEPFESVYAGTITNSYYFTLSSADVSASADPNDNLDNTDLITKIPDASTARIDTTYTSFAFSQVSYNERGEVVNAENGVWKFTQSFGPILTSANSIAISKHVLKTSELNDVAHLQFNGEAEGDSFDLTLISNASGYMAVSSVDNNFEINNYVFIKNAAEFNDRILNGENEYQSKKEEAYGPSIVSKKVYRLISNITFGASGNSGATIGTSTLQFEGVLDGNGLNINNLVITDTTIGDASATTRLLTSNKYVPSSLAVGMFAAMSNGATVKNLNVYVRQVAASNTDVVGSLVGILENSFVYNINILPYGEESENRVSGSFVAAGAIGMVLGDVTSFKIANVSSSISVAAVSINMPKITEGETNYNKIDQTVNEIYNGFGDKKANSEEIVNSSKKLILADLYHSENRTAIKDKYYEGLSIAAGVIGVTDVKTDDEDEATNNFVSQINNGAGNNVRLAQISRISASGSDLRLTARNAAGVIGIVDDNVFVHDVEFVVDKYENSETTQKIGGTLTVGGISIVNSGLIKYARIEHANQYELDRTYLSAETEYNYAQNSTRSLFTLTKENDIYNVFVGGITAINNVGEIVDSYVKVDVMPTINSTYPPKGYAGFASGLSIGGRISYFYSLADIDGANFTSGLIGYAVKNNGTYDFTTAFKDYQQEIVKHAVNDLPYIVVNTATIIVPTDTTVTSSQYNKYYTLAGYAATADIFGGQTIGATLSEGKPGYKTTLKNINFTNIGIQINADDTVTDRVLVGGSSKNAYYMQVGNAAAEEYYLVKSNYEGADETFNLNYSAHGGGADYKTIVNARAAITFRQFLASLRWNVFNTARMPFPFYGISQNIQYIKAPSDFEKLALYPDNVFVIQPKNDSYVIEIDSDDLADSAGIQFSGILTGRERVNNEGKTEYPTVKLNVTSSTTQSIFASTLDASIYNFNVEISTVSESINTGLFGKKATNTLFENINIYVKDDLKVSASGDGENGNTGLLVNNLTRGSIVRDVNVSGADEANAIINVSGNGSFGAIAGEISASVTSGSSITNLTLKPVSGSTLANIGGAFGRAINSTVSGLAINNFSINAGATNVGGAVGYAEHSTLNPISVTGVTLNGATVGGVVGHAKGTTIKNSYADKGTSGEIKGTSYAGGFAGILESDENVVSSVSYSFSNLKVSGATNAGGFVGKTSASISNSYAAGEVAGSTNVGGFAGLISGGSITTSYSTGKLTSATTNAGGFAGSAENGFTISNCFTLSRLDEVSITTRKNFIANLTSANGQTITNCYYASELNYKTTLANTRNTYKIADDEFNVGENESGEVNGVEARSLSKFFNTSSSSDFTISGFYKSGTISSDSVVYTFRIGATNGTPEKFSQNQAENDMLKARVVNAEAGSIANTDSLIYLIRHSSTSTTKGKLIDALNKKIIIGEELNSTAGAHINITDNTSIFGTITNSIITNLNVVVDRNVITNTVVANAVNNSILNKIVITGSFTAGTGDNVGAIAGALTNNSLLVNSHSDATINSDKNIVGGLVGELNTSTIIASYNSGNVTGTNKVGGLVGNVSAGTNTIYKCYNIGKVFGSTNVAGLVANVAGGATLNISSVYNTGLVTGESEMAGLVYADNSATLTLTNSYNTGAINNAKGADTYYPITNKAVGSNCYYNSDLFPEVVAGTVSANGTAKTSLELTTLTFENNNDFALLTENDISFPLLKGVGGVVVTSNNNVALGAQIKGKGANVIKVSEGADLVKSGPDYPTKSFIIVNDLNALGIANYDYTFTGTIYGCNHTIYNLRFSLLATAKNATISNLNFVGTNISDPNDVSSERQGDLGAPIANEFNDGFISNVMFTGELNAHLVSESNNVISAYAGGVVGKASGSTILYCNVIETDIYQYFGIATTGGTGRTAYIGGIVGKAENSYINQNTYSGNIYLGRGFYENSVGFSDVTNFYIGGVVGNNASGVVKNNIVQHQVFYATKLENNIAVDAELKETETAGAEQSISCVGNGTSAKAIVYNICAGAGEGNDYTRSTSLQNSTVSTQGFSNIIDLSINSTTKLGSSPVENATIKDLIAKIMSVEDIDGSTYKLSKLIYDADGFNAITENGYYKLVGSVDEIGSFNKAKAPKYFDGRGYVVSGITTNSGAMFDAIVENTTFKNIVISKASVTNSVTAWNDNSAVLTKVNNGTIKYVGIIDSTLDVINTPSDDNKTQTASYYSTPTFSNSYWAGNVGGLVGENRGSNSNVAYCYSMVQINIVGAVQGSVGGLVAYNNGGTVAYSYGSGLISFPYNANNGSNMFNSSGAVAVNHGTLTNVYANSDIMIASEEKTLSGYNTKTASAISIDMFKSVSGITQNGTSNAKNAGMPMLARHKNYTLYRPYAFNWKATSSAPTNAVANAIASFDNLKSINNSTSSYYLTNNIIIPSNNTTDVLINSFRGRLYFNGYSIIGYNYDKRLNNNTTKSTWGRYIVGLIGNASSSSIYDACMVNPRTKITVDTNSIMSTPSGANYWSSNMICVGALVADSVSFVTDNTNILGGYIYVTCENFTKNNPSTTINNELTSKSITLPTINIDGVNPDNTSSIKVKGNSGESQYAFSSSIYVKTAGARTQGLNPNGDKLLREMPFETYKSYFSKNTNHNFTYSWSSGFYQEQITNNVSSGNITVSNIRLSEVNNSQNIVNIQEGRVNTGSISLMSHNGGTYTGTGSGVNSAYNKLMSYIRGNHTLGTVTTGNITGAKVLGGSNCLILYAYSSNSSTGNTGDVPSYRVSFEWHKSSDDPLQSLGTAYYNITNRDSYRTKGSYTQAIR